MRSRTLSQNTQIRSVAPVTSNCVFTSYSKVEKDKYTEVCVDTFLLLVNVFIMFLFVTLRRLID